MTTDSAKPSNHIPQTSADPYEYIDERNIRIADSSWDCPNCGEDGILMHRPGSKNTCATCFFVRNGHYNDHVLRGWPLKYRQAQRLLASMGEAWHGTPGDIGTRLRQFFDRQEEAAVAMQELQTDEPVVGVTSLGDFQ